MTPTRFTPTRVLALLLLGAATVSSGVLAAPTSSMNSGLSSTGVARSEGLQSRSSPEQGSLLDVQRRGVEHVNLVPRVDDDRTYKVLHDDKGLLIIECPDGRVVEIQRPKNTESPKNSEQVEKDIQEGHAKLEEYRNRAATTSKPALFRTDPAVAGEIRIIVSDSIEIVGCPLAVASEAFVQSAKDNYREALEYLSENPMQKFIAEYRMSQFQKKRSTLSHGGQRQ
ncbi:hypothetical protein EV361DRAFT_181109 [Lentinula raphanica]|nr:hypothetical protein EV361DRAFT_181109 [Lentinula raphanica]